jgi:hypothetical protein
MKAKLFTMLVVVTVLCSVFVGSASAAASDTHFTTSITYVNVGSDITTTLDLLFYASAGDTAPTTYHLTQLAAGAASSLFVGSLDNTIVADGFQGDAVMQSDQPMLVTLVQIPMDSTDVFNRALSNGFSAGGPTNLIATVLKNVPSHYNSTFSIQNADSELNNVTINFYDISATLVHTINQPIEMGASFYVEAAAEAGLGASFNGSAVATATRAGGGAGSIVSSVMELQDNGVGLEAFEGVASGSMKFYMPSALCAFKNSTTYYAVQNTSLTNPTDVTVTYYMLPSGTFSQTKTVQPGAKQSFAGCDAAGMPSNALGAAVVESTSEDVIAIGKASGNGLTTAFNGVSVGYQAVALPYVRWADDAHWAAGTHQRTYITIQNVGADIAEGQTIAIEYKDPAGVTVATDTYTAPAGGLANGAKFNSSAQSAGLTDFGYWDNYTKAGGAAIITGPVGSQLSAVARVSTQTAPGFFTSEDYNSQQLP